MEFVCQLKYHLLFHHSAVLGHMALSNRPQYRNRRTRRRRRRSFTFML